MRYKFEIKYDMGKDELDEKLKEYYKYPLLNFAFVIADVFAEKSVFSPKFPVGKKRSDIKNEIVALCGIKSKLMKLVEDYVLKFYSSGSVKVLKNLNPEKRKKFYISEFRLKPTFNYIDDYIKGLEEMIDLHHIHSIDSIHSSVDDEYIINALIVRCFGPFFKKHKRSFSVPNQVSFLWSPVIRGNKIHWRNICNLICWFLEYLEGSTYKSKLDFPHGKNEEKIGANINVLKNQYQRIKEAYSSLIHTSCNLNYFPCKNNKPEKPYLFSEPVISVKYFHNKIKTIFKEKDKLMVRQTTFIEPERREHEIRQYEKDEEKKENSRLILEIV